MGGFLLLVLLIVIFIGFLNHFRMMFFAADSGVQSGIPAIAVQTSVVSAWMVVPMWLALIPVLVLGLWWPLGLWHFFERVATDLGGGPR